MAVWVEFCESKTPSLEMNMDVHFKAVDEPKRPQHTFSMELAYTYWRTKDGWLVGYLDLWPEHLTQGKDIAELEEMLLDLYEFYKEEQLETA